MSEDITKKPETKEAPKAVRSNPGKKAETENQTKGPKITKFPDGTIKEDF